MRGPGCFVCPWAAARPLAVRAASFARRVVSKPGQAPPPPTGTAARPRLEACPGPPVPPAPYTPVGRVVLSTIRLVSRPGLALPPPTGAAAKLAGSPGTLRAGGGGGFALHEAFRGRVVGVSYPRVVQFPPFGGGKAEA